MLSHLQVLHDKFNTIESWELTAVEAAITEVLQQFDISFGKLGKPLRYILTQGLSGVGLADLCCLLGKKVVLARIAEVVVYLQDK